MSLTQDQFALNIIQWMGPHPDGSTAYSYTDPAFRTTHRQILTQVRDVGFTSVAMRVLETETLQSYQRKLREVGLSVAPGYVQVMLPEDAGAQFSRRSSEWFRWFDTVRRRAEESNFLGLDTVFLASDVPKSGRVRVDEAVAVGADFDPSRLERVTELISDAADVLKSEGVRAGLHNHVGSWVETESEVEFVLDNVDESTLGAGFDIGHLVWAGADPVRLLDKYGSRLINLHIKDLDVAIATASRSQLTSYSAASDQRLFLELGMGDIDYSAIFAALPSAFTGWVVVEVDRPSMEPLASARQSWSWIRENIPAGTASRG